MANLGDDTEKFIDESMPLFFEKLGDSTALTEHGCLTVAQCALLIPATLSQNKPGDASEIAAHYVQLALLDIAEGELSPKHPQTLLPYSQYLRMMESGMHGVDGEALPMPTADWLVALHEAERWLKAKGLDINFDGLLEGLNTPTPAPVVAVSTCNEDNEWKEKARVMALEIIKRDRAKSLYPSQINIADEIAKKFRKDCVVGAEGKPLTGSYIKRHALTGLSSAQGKQLSTPIRWGK
jgi:hypothetical protein